jgi:hypothetical protein
MEHLAPALASYFDAALQSRFRKQLLDGRRCKKPMTYGAWRRMVSQFTKLPGASTSLPAYWHSNETSTDWQCAMQTLHGDNWKSKLCKTSRGTTKWTRQQKKKNVKVGGHWHDKVRNKERIKQKRAFERQKTRKRPATYRPSNMESLADWLRKHDFPSRSGKTKTERQLGEFVSNQKQAYVGNRRPCLTMDDIRKLEELPGWTSPLPSFGKMLGILKDMEQDQGLLKKVTVQLCLVSLSARSASCHINKHQLSRARKDSQAKPSRDKTRKDQTRQAKPSQATSRW